MSAYCAETHDNNVFFELEFPFWAKIKSESMKQEKVPVGKTIFTLPKVDSQLDGGIFTTNRVSVHQPANSTWRNWQKSTLSSSISKMMKSKILRAGISLKSKPKKTETI
jgi:hypothetical protein